MPHCCHNPIHCILPPHILERLSRSADENIRKLAVGAIEAAAAMRAQRLVLATMPAMSAIPSPAGGKDRLVYDMKHRSTWSLPGTLVRKEGDGPAQDVAVNEAYDYSGDVYDFYREIYSRNSLDNRGMSLISSVHVGENFNNAFWNGEQMAYGDGDGSLFLRFTKALDVVGHELSHGVVTHTCNLQYQDEPGALNEHFADVMGALVSQWRAGQTVEQAAWTIGSEIMGPGTAAKCLRTFKDEPAYTGDPILGDDPQPKHLQDKFTGSADHGGVHINSGIPNHAFFVAAMEIGGYAWEKTGRIWYKTLRALNQSSDFREMVEETEASALSLYGAGSMEQKAVIKAWNAVGF